MTKSVVVITLILLSYIYGTTCLQTRHRFLGNQDKLDVIGRLQVKHTGTECEKCCLYHNCYQLVLNSQRSKPSESHFTPGFQCELTVPAIGYGISFERWQLSHDKI